MNICITPALVESFAGSGGRILWSIRREPRRKRRQRVTTPEYFHPNGTAATTSIAIRAMVRTGGNRPGALSRGWSLSACTNSPNGRKSLRDPAGGRKPTEAMREAPPYSCRSYVGGPKKTGPLGKRPPFEDQSNRRNDEREKPSSPERR